MTPLRQKMIDNMKLRGFAPNTQEAYVAAVAGLAKYYRESPDKLDTEKVQRYLLYLMEERKLSWNSCNVVAAGLRFFYTETLKWHPTAILIPSRKKKTQLPEILSRQELERLFVSTMNRKHRVMLMTAYGAGLRVSELVRMKVSDIDSQRMVIRVEQGKGNKDRYTILSQRLLTELRDYWKIYRPPTWLFPSKDQNQHVCPAIPKSLKEAILWRSLLMYPVKADRLIGSRCLITSKTLAGGSVFEWTRQSPA